MASPPLQDTDDDSDDPETEPCYRHPGRQTALHCSNCDRPICVDCSIPAAVGLKCPECGRVSRAALAVIPRTKLLSGAAAALVVSLVAGWAFYIFSVPFIGLILGFAVGAGIGTLAVKAAGGFRDPALARVVVACVVVGFLAPLAVALITSHNHTAVLRYGTFRSVIVTIIAAVGAWQRSR